MLSRLSTNRAQSALLAAIVFIAITVFVFNRSLRPGDVLFANDGPLGVLVSDSLKMPDGYAGMWMDANWLGAPGGSGAIGFTYLLLWILGPVGFAKFYVPFTLVILGLCAWFFFRRLGFASAVCLLGGLAAALNSNFFSNACWGLATRGLSLAAAFLALAAVQSSFSSRSYFESLLKVILAGLAIGLSICEGGDNGAIFSLFIAAFAFFGSLAHRGSGLKGVMVGGLTVAVMAVFAAIMAAQTLSMFVGKDVKGTAMADQAAMSKEERWNWATQWSLPKAESLRVIVPGLFGYRLDTPEGGEYWGDVGQAPGWVEGHKDASWVRQHPNAFPRHSGAGEYAGVLVVLLGLWALAHSFVRQGSSFSQIERRMIWFWGGAAFVALLLSWGRHAPFYQIVYALPYFSTIRNPMKFMHPCHMAIMILCGYGVEGLWRRYLKPAASGVVKAKGPAATSHFDKFWLIGSLVLFGLAVVVWFVYGASQSALVRHLVDQYDFESGAATAIAKFSSGEVGRSIFFLLMSLGLLFLIGRGFFAGSRAIWAAVAMGVLIVADLCSANVPWIKYYDYHAKYANNAVLKVLADKPYEHRVALPPLQWDRNYSIFGQIYTVEWLQHQFPYYNIQSLDQPQEPRPPADKTAYRMALGANIVRLWELTNTRFLCGMGGNFADALNQQLDPAQRRFRVHTRFNLSQDEDKNKDRYFNARVDNNGVFALIEFTGALPRAKLYSKWQVSTNDQATLTRLSSPEFNPHEELIVANNIAAPSAVPTNSTAGSVEFVSYASKRIQLRANTQAPSILLLNDKFDPEWKALVDGLSVQILRCNFFMRGVQIPPGNHTVEFRYEPSKTIFVISLSATLFGLVLCITLWVMRRGEQTLARGAS